LKAAERAANVMLEYELFAVEAFVCRLCGLDERGLSRPVYLHAALAEILRPKIG